MKTALCLALATACFAQTFDPKMPSGVPAVSGPVVELATMRYIEIQPGSGPAAGPGQQYTVHYAGWLRDGTRFDSSIGKDPLQFVQGRRQVIAGWEMGFQGMHVGGKRRLFIPYQLAYGEQGRGPIPPKAELIFDVQLLAIKDAPEISPAADLVFPLNGTRDKIVQLAKTIPADKYDWRPAAGVRSFKEVFIHIAFGTRMMMSAADGAAVEALRKQIEENSKAEQQPMTKDQVIAALAENLDAYRKALETARAGALSRDVNFFGTATTRRAVLADIDTHIAEHLGQLIAYARMNGIVPPWSK